VRHLVASCGVLRFLGGSYKAVSISNGQHPPAHLLLSVRPCEDQSFNQSIFIVAEVAQPLQRPFAVAGVRFEPQPGCICLLKELFQIIPMRMMIREIIPGRKQKAQRCPQTVTVRL